MTPLARSLHDGLEREGYVVACKATAGEGIAHARDQGPQLIILDVRLPDGCALDRCRRLRGMGRRQPVLILTVQREEV